MDLQTAINNASAGDSVFVAQGTYTGSFVMKEGVKIYGGFAGTEASLTDRNLVAGHISTLNGNGGGRVVVNNNNGLTSAAEVLSTIRMALLLSAIVSFMIMLLPAAGAEPSTIN
jgi:hypothetical protein